MLLCVTWFAWGPAAHARTDEFPLAPEVGGVSVDGIVAFMPTHLQMAAGRFDLDVWLRNDHHRAVRLHPGSVRCGSGEREVEVIPTSWGQGWLELAPGEAQRLRLRCPYEPERLGHCHYTPGPDVFVVIPEVRTAGSNSRVLLEDIVWRMPLGRLYRLEDPEPLACLSFVRPPPEPVSLVPPTAWYDRSLYDPDAHEDRWVPPSFELRVEEQAAAAHGRSVRGVLSVVEDRVWGTPPRSRRRDAADPVLQPGTPLTAAERDRVAALAAWALREAPAVLTVGAPDGTVYRVSVTVGERSRVLVHENVCTPELRALLELVAPHAPGAGVRCR